MKSVFYEFDPVIYPTRLWVCVKPKLEDVEDVFYSVNKDGSIAEGCFVPDDLLSPTSYLTTHVVGRKSSGWMGCLVSILKPKETKAGLIAHEALHCTSFTCLSMGITCNSFDDSEPWAYYTQWVADCINCVRCGHPERMKGVKVE